MTRVVDFDAARAERDREPVTLRIGGRDYRLSAGLPASIALELMRFRVDQSDDIDVPLEEVAPLLERLFGRENWQAILDEGRLEVDEMPQLLDMTVRALKGGSDDGSPNRVQRRATGRRRASAGSKTGR